MSFISLWPLLLAQITVMSLTIILLAADRRFFSWDCFVVCTLSMMMAEGIVIMKYELWHIPPALLGLAGVLSWLLLPLHTGYFSGMSEGVHKRLWLAVASVLSGAGMMIFYWLSQSSETIMK
ncbi:hypothetical protein AB9E53_18955 [Escherichia coli]|uniref:hypothetical protein n=1 Tax=Escherichia coli TaxID=562 RepID=UPI000BE31BC8|nr:hypothetical protein [Escherichia coli]EFE9644851.1 hypothetical protein [Escherichia coli]EFH3711110.1 hypothetical protein [Escherichia coli]EFM6377311.1 hypothetical protein [Escherichia coli]EFM6391390.1 hypothetical protein [Escherichia coli]EFM6406197.1 hypothetical protein [Escherichia coli]